MLIIGRDLHSRYQQIAMAVSQRGELVQAPVRALQRLCPGLCQNRLNLCLAKS